MIIGNVCSTNFNGLWRYAGTLKKETGAYYKNKAIYTVHKFVYHPWESESADAINKQTDKHFWGRSFSLWDLFDNHYKADLYQMNHVAIGEPIKQADEKILLQKGYCKDFCGGVLEEDEFISAYSNETYSPFDIDNMSKEKVKELAAKHFGICG